MGSGGRARRMLGIDAREWSQCRGGMAAAVRTGDVGHFGGRAVCEDGLGGASFYGGLVLREQEGVSCVFALGSLRGMPESVVADFVKALGKHMLEEPAHKLVPGKGTGAPLRTLAVFVAECDCTLVDGLDASVGDGDAVDVAGEIVEHGCFTPSP